ncbi:MAG: ABC-F family ATP-binding cassette domain-containing protein [Bacteroides graminisolvens]|jgi:ATPase components of ABC transporters with duplicated ATPase domains|uniref:Probable ATP-binding protein YbiT n=1 Tax=Bacteroides graminisolvens DSM 19988 = JCM 15093 TaxID=1121097 RepID=A0A069D417_9BACE|nr:ABC-F family ATP-binding cassette domain-containing protein [Bacteroides graminisolvens]MBP6249656.1 ABC-F family ATP-binding cassette domain-containing protein [Bacteroides sp.]MBP6981010.1 ABC-F family ATP-binding cassette domain-containing protein [Bacteroides sp.]MBP7293687.1 ABC-F family ATP-binding cassette domain-containing protein [Bacteroides sp.]MBP9495951.1 ABC-F family ATP-binding cassette domain-containing protein [Bacteroides sp.]MBP9553365.1 ABC-F family ATP-binding cassette 
MISVDGLTVEFGGSTLFSDISFVINEKDRIALMGKNGAGKSTLLKILAGARPATRGKISAPKESVIAYLPQHLMTEDGRTVFEETALAFSHIHDMEAQIERLNKELETRTDYESDSYMNLIEEVSALSEKFYAIDLTNYEEDVEKALLGLGFEREDFGRPTKDFSGGWRMRIELAKLLLQKPDVLLLDEPTNHLDIESIQWLEDFLINSAKAVIVISHDRKFVDNITTRTIEVTMGRIYDYKVNYSKYLELRKERREQQQKAFEEQQKFIAETKEFIERFKGTYSKTLQVQSRVKMLEKLEILEVDEEDTSALRLKFPPSPRSGNYPVIMENVGKQYGDHVVFKNASLTIERGDKVAFVGRNGEGKSTLVKCIMKEIEHNGTLTLGHNIQIGYFAQNQASMLDENLTVFQTIDDVAKGDIRNKIRDLLGAFMFGGEESTKKVKVLSGGERTRLAMIKLLLEPVNLLILDEPTNHLDMKTKDILKQALADFDGTLIVVSHDRDFLDGLVTKVYEFGNKKVTEHLCGIYEFLEKKKMLSLNELEKK